jgi:hypothetical protein
VWVPNPNWQPPPSFPQRVAPPTGEPCDPPLVCVQFNQAYLPYVIGALTQLCQPTAWDKTTISDMAGVLGSMTDLLALFGDAMPCSTNPPALPGHTTAQTACNVAGYLANSVIKSAMQKAIDAINANLTVLGWGQLIIGLIPGAGFVINALITALSDLYQAMVSGTLADYQDAVNDSTLWGKIGCAIYGCISADGGVTAGNFPCVVAAVGAVPYTHADVISAIVAFLNNAGWDGIASMQAVGALAVYDCSGCGSGTMPGPPGSPPLREAGKTTLTILAGTAAKTVDVLFEVPWTAPPVVTVSCDSQVLIASVASVTDTDMQVSITAAVAVLADTTATVSWEAVMRGSL